MVKKKKLRLRRLRLSDVDNLKKVINNKEVIERLDDNSIKYPFLRKDAKKYIKKSLENKDSYEFAIIVENNFVGTIVLENPNSGKKGYEVGYVVARDSWNKGIATNALKEICKFGFNKLRIKRIWAGILSNNPASRRVLEKAGFKFEGRLKNSTYKNKKYYDDLIYGKIKK